VPGTPRLLINRERVGGFSFDFSAGSTDTHYMGDCDAGVRELARLVGWEAELDALEQKAIPKRS